MDIQRVFILALALVGAACQPAEAPATPTAALAPTPTTAPKPTTAPEPTVSEGSPLRGVVRIWLSWNPQELESLERVVRTFQLEYPEISFEIAYFTQESLKNAFLEAETGAPTILFGPSTWGPELWERGVLLGLQDRVDRELQEAIDPAAWSQIAYRDAVIGMPLERHGVLLYRNRALVEDSAATTQTWITKAIELREGDNLGLALDYGFRYSSSHIAACDGALFDENGELLLQGEAGICWLNLLSDLRQVGRVSFNSDEDLDLFLEGQAAWMFGGTWNLTRVRREVGEDRLAIDPWPVFPETGLPLRGYVWTENAYLRPTDAASDLEASWAFVRFLLSPEAQLQLADPVRAGHLPALAQLELQDPFQARAEGALASGVGLPLIPNLDLYTTPLEGAVRSVAIQGANPELALTIAVSKIEQALAKLKAQP